MNNDARVERCRLAFVCGQRWEELEQLPNNEQVRFCQRCQSSVHLATPRPRRLPSIAAQGSLRCGGHAFAWNAWLGEPCSPYRDVSAGGGRRKQSIRGGVVPPRITLHELTNRRSVTG
jgi:hypothetical protein